MDRIIEVKVNGGYLSMDSRKAGNQHEANITKLRITFDAGWDGFAKTLTFWNAKGQNPVKRILTEDLLEVLTNSGRVYICTIPGEALTESGMMTFTIDGYVNGVRQRTLRAELEVEESPYLEHAGQPADPTPSQAEQLQVQIDTLLGDMQAEARKAEEAADNAAQSENFAAMSASAAQTAAENAAMSEANAQSAAEAVKAAEDIVVPLAEATKANAQSAVTSAAAAAAMSANAAESAAVAVDAANLVSSGVQLAEAAAARAESSAAEAEGYKDSAAASGAARDQAVQAAQAAANSAREAAESAAKAGEIAGGDLNAIVVAQIAEHNQNANAHADIRGLVTAAESAAKAYADQKIAAIPTPDVSGQIGTHNTSTSAHVDIRQAVDGKVPWINACSSSYDMDVIMRTPNKGLYMTDGSTLGTPKQYGKTAYASALILTYTDGNYGIQVAYSAGQFVFTRKIDNGTLGAWCSVYTEDNKPTAADVGAVETKKNLTPESVGYAILLRYMASRYDEHVVVYANVSGFSDMPTGVTSGQAVLNMMDGILTATLYTRTAVYTRGTNDLSSWTGNWRKVYDEDNKPTYTASEVGAAPATHNHDAGHITSGTLPVARGGTGVTSLDALATALGATKVVTGSYTGIGTSGTGTPLSVNIGFRPKVVMIHRCTAIAAETNSSSVIFEIKTDYGALEMKYSSTATYMPEQVTIVDTGFTVKTTNKYGINYSGDTYAYIAYG